METEQKDWENAQLLHLFYYITYYNTPTIVHYNICYVIILLIRLSKFTTISTDRRCWHSVRCRNEKIELVLCFYFIRNYPVRAMLKVLKEGVIYQSKVPSAFCRGVKICDKRKRIFSHNLNTPYYDYLYMLKVDII